MKKFLLIILTISYFGVAQAREYQRPREYKRDSTSNFWIPAATALTIIGLIELHNRSDQVNYENQIRVTVNLIGDADDLYELREIKRTRARYFTEGVNRVYLEKRDNLSYRERERRYFRSRRGELRTIILIEDAYSLRELRRIRKDRSRYFSRRVKREYRERERELKWRQSREWRDQGDYRKAKRSGY